MLRHKSPLLESSPLPALVPRATLPQGEGGPEQVVATVNRFVIGPWVLRPIKSPRSEKALNRGYHYYLAGSTLPNL